MKRRVIISIAALILLFSALLTLNAYADDEIYGVSSALIVRDKDIYHIEVTAQLPKADAASMSGETLYLFELFPYHSASKINELSPVAQLKASEKMTFMLDYEEGTQRIYAKFLIARKMADQNYRILGGAHYIDNVELIAKNSYDYPISISKKGLTIQNYSDAQELGVAQAIINVPVNDYLAAGKTAETIDFIYNNTTFYLNRDMLAYLDYRVKILSDSGANIYINLLLDAPSPDQSDSLDVLYKSEITSAVSLYGFNVSERDTVMYLESFVHFLAERYTAQDGDYGFVGSYILGYQVNSNRAYNNLGQMPLDNYLNLYTVAFRVVDTALRSVYANGRTYISLANNFNSSIIEPNAQYDELLDYSAKDTLDLFAFKIKSAGDIPWRLAVYAYPSDRTLTDFRADAMSTADESTPYISMSNIETLCDYMGKDELLYKGMKRKLTVAGFGINAENDSASSLTQASLYAYAYFKAVMLDDIEALIYYRHVDNPIEVGKFGLWTTASETEPKPLDKKSIYNVFRYIDTDRSEATVQFALSQLGVTDWATLVPGFTFDKTESKYLIEQPAADVDTLAKQGEPSLLFDFTHGSAMGFLPTDSSANVELSEIAVDDPILHSALISTDPTEYMGVGCDFDAPTEIKGAKFIALNMACDAPGDVQTVSVMVRMYKNAAADSKPVIYEGVANAVKTGSMTSVAFDISALTASTDVIDGIKIWVRPTDQSYHEGDYELWLRGIELYGGGTNILAIIGWIAVVALIASAIGFAGIVISRNIRVRMKRKNRKNPLRPEDSGTMDIGIVNRPLVNPLPDPTRTNTGISRVQSQRPQSAPPKSQTGTTQRPQTGTPQRPQAGTPQRPQTGTPQRPQTGIPQRPQTGTPQRPQTGTPQRPNTNAPQRPQNTNDQTVHRPPAPPRKK